MGKGKNQDTCENAIIEITKETVRNKIYTIRGQQVMLDSDLAEIYGYTTKRFNEQVKRNATKFENDFMFQLTQIEVDNLRAQNATLNITEDGKNVVIDIDFLRSQNATSNRGGTRYLPYAFTEQGIYMLMTVLKGELATQQSKALIRLFKGMKDYIVENQGLNPLFLRTTQLQCISREHKSLICCELAYTEENPASLRAKRSVLSMAA